MSLKQRITAATLSVLLSAGIVVSAGGAGIAASAQNSPIWQGCMSGYVCMYKDNYAYAAGQPYAQYYNYGWYNFYGQYGNQIIFNNQTGGAKASLWYNYGTGSLHKTYGYGKYSVNITPINQISLSR